MTNKSNIKFNDWDGNEYDLPEGRTYTWRPSAYATIVNDNKLLCVKPSWIDRWELPGGEIELHEGPLEAVVREVYEETGYSVKCSDETPIYLTHNFFYIKPYDSYKHSIQMVFDAKLVDLLQKTKHIDPYEVKEIKWIDINELENYNLHKLIQKILKKS